MTKAHAGVRHTLIMLGFSTAHLYSGAQNHVKQAIHFHINQRPSRHLWWHGTSQSSHLLRSFQSVTQWLGAKWSPSGGACSGIILYCLLLLVLVLVDALVSSCFCLQLIVYRYKTKHTVDICFTGTTSKPSSSTLCTIIAMRLQAKARLQLIPSYRCPIAAYIQCICSRNKVLVRNTGCAYLAMHLKIGDFKLGCDLVGEFP